MLVGMGVMAAGCVLFGLAPQLLMDTVVAPAAHGLGFADTVGTSWGGVATGRGSIGLTVGASLVAAALAIAWMAWHFAATPSARPVAVFTGGEPLPVGDRPGAIDFAGLAEDAFHPVYAFDPDCAWFGLWGSTTRLAAAGRTAVAPLTERRPLAVVLLSGLAVAAAIALG
jgi:multicomponent Na+:H+ antiporter subunit A